MSVNCPLNDETRGLVDAAKLAKMKSTAYLINTARKPSSHDRGLASRALVFCVNLHVVVQRRVRVGVGGAWDAGVGGRADRARAGAAARLRGRGVGIKG